MTQEQWLVYIWSIYPKGGWSFVWAACLVVACILLIISGLVYNDAERDDCYKNSSSYYTNTIWYKLGKWKVILPSIFATLLFLSSLVPNRDGLMYILATPYVVDSGKSIIEDLKDENSKAFKLNKLLDKSLDKALQAMDTDMKERKK